jgi:hypothetical protein
MRVQDGTTLAPFHPVDDGEVGRYFGGTQEVLGPETRFAVYLSMAACDHRNEGPHV